MIKSLDEILEMIINGQISIREACREFGYTRDIIRRNLIKKYGNNENLVETLKNNKANSTTLELPQELLEQVFIKAMNKEITLEEAQKILNIQDKETLRAKFLEYAESSENEKIRNLYKNYMKDHERDYSHINFRLLAIKMVKAGVSQSDVARYLEIPPRVISREFEKFSKDEDLSFYNFIKSYNEAMMLKTEFTNYTISLQNIFLEQYEKTHQDELYNIPKSKKQERMEREEYYVKEEARLKKEGLTQEQIAERLGTSVSTLRRARNNIKKREVLAQIEAESKTPDKEDDEDFR